MNRCSVYERKCINNTNGSCEVTIKNSPLQPSLALLMCLAESKSSTAKHFDLAQLHSLPVSCTTFSLVSASDELRKATRIQLFEEWSPKWSSEFQSSIEHSCSRSEKKQALAIRDLLTSSSPATDYLLLKARSPRAGSARAQAPPAREQEFRSQHARRRLGCLRSRLVSLSFVNCRLSSSKPVPDECSRQFLLWLLHHYIPFPRKDWLLGQAGSSKVFKDNAE